MDKTEFRKNVFIFTCIFLIIGYISGSFLIRFFSFDVKYSCDFVEEVSLKLSFLEGTAFVLFIYLNGFSTIGFIFDFMTVYVRALFSGFFAAGYYVIYGFKAIGRVILYIVPGACALFVVIAMLATESVCISISILDQKKDMHEKIVCLHQYAGKGAFLCSGSLVFVVWRAFIAPFIARIFF